ncbi:glycine oxidase ThiO [Rugosimonospora africana]|uniref:glycine oxidase n=1 Tax=Rugosimonospora africana TaxID=556532 RepID=A0A8J3VWH9_9ACTN|nr:glycine oxidase ThiO [Rugosimonospora africana]GIH20876.1 glycine oxidase ThiO [Rugosimonospora africana]
MGSTADVVVVGAGVIGLSVAWRCAQRGLTVTVVDPQPGSGASWTAAGMLAPVTELHYEGRSLLALNQDSAARYPGFVAELADLVGLDVGYARCGTVQAAWDAADLAALRDLHAFQAALGVESRMLTARELREAEPGLAAGLPGGLWAADDHQIDNRLLHGALARAVAVAGVREIRARVGGWLVDGDRVTGVRTGDGQAVRAGTTVLAAGAWSATIGTLPAGALPPVRPVKGQTLRLRGPAGLLAHVVRGAVRGNPVYLVPRGDGSLVVGASSEEAGFDLSPRAGAVYELLRDAQLLVPALGEVRFEEVSTSVRPGSPDNLPMIGASALDGLIVATGHYRNGILLAPLTADAVADLATGRPPDTDLAACDPRRFTRSEVEV